MTGTTNTPAPVADQDNRAAFEADMHAINPGVCQAVLDIYWDSTEGKLWRAALARRTDHAEPAVAAIQFVLDNDDEDENNMSLLRLWNEGEFDKLRREWPEAPEAIYIGADPLHPATKRSADLVADTMDHAQLQALGQQQKGGA